MVSPAAGCRQKGAGKGAEAVFSSLSTWRISNKYRISTLKKESIQNKQLRGLAVLPEVWADDHYLLLGTEPNGKAISRRTSLRRDLGESLPSSQHRPATAPHGAHRWLPGLLGLLGGILSSACCFSCQVQLMVQSSGGNHLHLSQKK